MICIFNPEHDLCLANGTPHYMPPVSALRFAQQSASLMQILYPEAETCIPAAAVAALPSSQWSQIVPWGWNCVLKEQLQASGVPMALLPSDDDLCRWRQLQHRSTWLALQPDSRAVTTVSQVEALLAVHSQLVLKAPWSGSGRGIRWVTDGLNKLDVSWLEKVVRQQGCVIAEPRRQVAEEFALEYMVFADRLAFLGFSLFSSANGVYQGNLLLPDEAIRHRVRFTLAEQQALEDYLQAHLVGQYHGPLGIDYLHTTDGQNHLSELNLRHTMGMLAHAYLAQHPESQGTLFQPTKK
ncbi:MAG: hypothetical protein IKK04_04800 [Bacteroidales bacterium]|nr:hypothetical protein [Bacteroidales bacterium]